MKEMVSMKKSGKSSAVPAMIIFVLAVLAAVGVRTFFRPCIHDDGAFGACYWAGQAIFGLSLVLAAEGLAAVLLRDSGVRKGLYIAMLLTAVPGFFLPGTLISLCGMASMRCRALMRPAVIILYAVMDAAAAAGIFLSKMKSRV